jgi:hypothetical protein
MNLSSNSSSDYSQVETSLKLNLIYLIPIKLIMGLIGATFNGYIIILVLFIIKNKSYSNFLFMGCAIADLSSNIISVPFLTIFTSVGYWPLGKTPCIIWVINDFSVESISVYSLLLIAIHRYMQIKMPTYETEKMTRKKYAIIATQWVLIYSFWGIAVLIITADPSFAPEDCYFTYTFSYVLCANLFGYCLPILGVLVVNSLVFYELVKKKRANEKMSGSAKKGILKGKNNTAAITTIADTEDLSVQNSILALAKSQQEGNLNKKKRREMTRSRQVRAMVCLYVVTGFLTSAFVIFCVTWPLKAMCETCVNDILFEIGYWTCYAYSAFNPIVLLIFHDKFGKEFLKTAMKLRNFLAAH